MGVFCGICGSYTRRYPLGQDLHWLSEMTGSKSPITGEHFGLPGKKKRCTSGGNVQPAGTTMRVFFPPVLFAFIVAWKDSNVCRWHLQRQKHPPHTSIRQHTTHQYPVKVVVNTENTCICLTAYVSSTPEGMLVLCCIVWIYEHMLRYPIVGCAVVELIHVCFLPLNRLGSVSTFSST